MAEETYKYGTHEKEKVALGVIVYTQLKSLKVSFL